MHLLRALGDDEQVEPELAAFTGDPDGVLGGERGRAGRPGPAGRRCVPRRSRSPSARAAPRRHRRSSTAPATSACSSLVPASRGRRPGSEGQPGSRARRAASRPPARARCRSDRRQGCARAAQGLGRRSARSSRLRSVSSSSRAASSEYSSRSASGSRRSRAAWCAAPDRGSATGSRPTLDPPRTRTDAAASAAALGVHARLAEAHEVGVRVEQHEPQVSLDQEPLEEHAERVRLARARLPAEEGVAAEATGVEPERHPGGERESATSRCAPSGARSSSQAATSSGVADARARRGTDARRRAGRRRPRHQLECGPARPRRGTCWWRIASDSS